MAGGVLTTGVRRGRNGDADRPYTRAEFLDNIQKIIDQDIVDIVLASASNIEALTRAGAFRNSNIAPAIRANDTTDVWIAIRGAEYASNPSRPFRSASLKRARMMNDRTNEGSVDLGLYSITFNNDLDHDYRSLEAFSQFRDDAAEVGFKYFLEVFDPNVNTGLSPEEVPSYVNDCIIRSLAGIVEADRPQFLKVVYNGPKALEELSGFDPDVVVGVLGGSAGTTRDCFELLHQAERFGARVALFGRKINLAEHPLALIALMRNVLDGNINPAEAVRAYHGKLKDASIAPARSLEEDVRVTSTALLEAAA